MRFRAGPLAAWALLHLLTGAPALADWKVHRSAADAVDRLAGALRARPDREQMATQLLRGRSAVQKARLLRLFEREAAERSGEFGPALAYAQLLLAAGRWDEAADRFGAAAQLSPLDLAPRWGRGRCLTRAGRSREAVQELRAALAVARLPRDIQAVARALMVAAAGIGDVEAEVEGRRALVAAQPGDQAVIELAEALNRAGRPGEAAGTLSGRAARAGAEGTPAIRRARWALAEGAYRAADGDLEGAARVLALAARQAPIGQLNLRRAVWQTLVDVERRRGRLDDAKQLLLNPVDAVEWAALARIDDEAGDLRGAWAAMAQAVRRSPRDLDLRLAEIAAARRVGTSREVAALYQDLAAVAARSASDAPARVVDALDGLRELGRADLVGAAVDKMVAGDPPASLLRALGEATARWGEHVRAERCWTALRRRDPADESAIVALGELRLQRGQRRSAEEIWRAVLRSPGLSPAAAHARLAEILADHDLVEQALAEARIACARQPTAPRYQRLVATILERQSRWTEAESAWEAVLRMTGGGGGRAAERDEARARLVALWKGAGSAQLEAKLRDLEQTVARDPADQEARLFLIQALLRTDRTDAAIALLEGALRPRFGGDAPTPRLESEALGAEGGLSPEKMESPAKAKAKATGRGVGAAADVETDAALILVLVRTLRQAQRVPEAMTWLEVLARRFPSHAADARLQLADLALATHVDRRAAEYATSAAATPSADARLLLRAASVQERLGHLEQAETMYRSLLGPRDRDPLAALALASLLVRRAEVDEPRSLLRDVVRSARADDASIAVAGARAVNLEEAAGTLADFEAFLADTRDLNGDTPAAAARRRVLAAVLWRMTPSLYRARALGGDVAAAVRLQRLARHGVRPLLDLVEAPDAGADAHAVEVLGMLGRPEAVPVLARLLIPDRPAGVEAGPAASGPDSIGHSDLAAPIVIALGRLGGELARVTLETLSAQETAPALRLPLLWALGRVGGPVATDRARQEIDRATTDGGIVACLAFGRAGGAAAPAVLSAVAEDAARPVSVRVAAILGLGLGAQTTTTPLLSRLARTADPDLSAAARTALRWMGGLGASRPGPPAASPGPAIVAAPAGDASSSHSLPRIPDEAAGIVAGLLDADALLVALLTPTIDADAAGGGGTDSVGDGAPVTRGRLGAPP